MAGAGGGHAQADRAGVLLIPQGDACYNNDPCMSVLIRRGDAGACVVPEAALAGLDLTGPLFLAGLPLQLWRAPGITGRSGLEEGQGSAAVEAAPFLEATGPGGTLARMASGKAPKFGIVFPFAFPLGSK